MTTSLVNTASFRPRLKTMCKNRSPYVHERPQDGTAKMNLAAEAAAVYFICRFYPNFVLDHIRESWRAAAKVCEIFARAAGAGRPEGAKVSCVALCRLARPRTDPRPATVAFCLFSSLTTCKPCAVCAHRHLAPPARASQPACAPFLALRPPTTSHHTASRLPRSLSFFFVCFSLFTYKQALTPSSPLWPAVSLFRSKQKQQGRKGEKLTPPNTI